MLLLLLGVMILRWLFGFKCALSVIMCRFWPPHLSFIVALPCTNMMFPVSIRNLPPHSTAAMKVTYIAELLFFFWKQAWKIPVSVSVSLSVTIEACNDGCRCLAENRDESRGRDGGESDNPRWRLSAADSIGWAACAKNVGRTASRWPR